MKTIRIIGCFVTVIMAAASTAHAQYNYQAQQLNWQLQQLNQNMAQQNAAMRQQQLNNQMQQAGNGLGMAIAAMVAQAQQRKMLAAIPQDDLVTMYHAAVARGDLRAVMTLRGEVDRRKQAAIDAKQKAIADEEEKRRPKIASR